MKRLCVICAAFLLFLGCKSSEGISFCEGVSPGGEGKRCGTTFTTGDVTALITASANFDAESVEVMVYEKGKYSYKLLETMTLKVKPDQKRARGNIALYNEGVFRVVVRGKDEKVIAQGDITVVDTY
jgi:hypothetical protein